ncbi:hypothetical protein LguiB_003539 [Lonicera macranthoides]
MARITSARFDVGQFHLGFDPADCTCIRSSYGLSSVATNNELQSSNGYRLACIVEQVAGGTMGPWRTSENATAFFKKCKDSKNPEALYRQGVSYSYVFEGDN